MLMISYVILKYAPYDWLKYRGMAILVCRRKNIAIRGAVRDFVFIYLLSVRGAKENDAAFKLVWNDDWNVSETSQVSLFSIFILIKYDNQWFAVAPRNNLTVVL